MKFTAVILTRFGSLAYLLTQVLPDSWGAPFGDAMQLGLTCRGNGLKLEIGIPDKALGVSIPKTNLKLVTQPQDFFRELVTDALGRNQVRTRPETEFYLVNLLNQFVSAEKLTQEPLALLVKDAIERPEVHEQQARFRHVGDLSLYVAGFFQDSLNRKLVDVDYYIGMGGTAYQHAAARSAEQTLRGVFHELAERFSTFVDVLADVSEKTTPRTEKDLLRLYEVWVTTRSERAAKALQEAGILPNDTVKKDWQ